MVINMHITIKISKKTAEHLKDGHLWVTKVCEEAEEVLVKIQKQINKKLKAKSRERK